jgi:hypothetical protein
MKQSPVYIPMSESNLSIEIRQFIQMYVPSLGALEVLLLLHKNPWEHWTPSSITEQLRSNSAMVDEFLAFFQSKNILINEGSTYSLNQDIQEFNLRLKELSKLFYQRPVSVLNEIYRIPHKPGTKIQLFADAFKIKKEK